MKAFFQNLYNNHLPLILLILLIVMIILVIFIVLSKYLEKRKEKKVILQNIKNQKIYTQEEIDNIAKNVSNKETFIQSMSTPVEVEDTASTTPLKKNTKTKKKQLVDKIDDNIIVENTPNKEVISADEVNKKASTKKVVNSSLKKDNQTTTKKTTTSTANKTASQTKKTTTTKAVSGQVNNEIATTKKTQTIKVSSKKTTDVNNNAKPKVSYSGKWKIVQVDDKYYAELLASNGGKLLKTELYASLSGAKNGINTIKKNIDDGNFTISSDKYGHYRFKLFSKLNRLICVSDDYSSRDKCDKGIESVKRFAKSAYIIIEEN